MEYLFCYRKFVNEELKYLLPPSDEETWEAFKYKSAFDSFEAYFQYNLDNKYFQVALDKLKQLPLNKILEICRRFQLGDAGFQIAFDNGLLENIKPNQLLVKASQVSSLKYVKYALENGADINYARKNDDTALMYASKRGKIEIVQYLISHGADVNIRNQKNWTALTYAAYLGQFEVVKYLVYNGANINIIDTGNYWTVTMQAAWKGYFDIVKFLVENGADLTVRDKNNDTILQIVRKGSKTDWYLKKILNS